MTAKQMTEAQAVNLVRNALLAAGHDMGKDGDHWPVIKSTVYSIMKDYEDLQIERNVHAELKIQLGQLLTEMDRELNNCDDDVRPKIAHELKQMNDIYDAYFSGVEHKHIELSDEDVPAHVKRAEHLINSLEDDNG